MPNITIFAENLAQRSLHGGLSAKEIARELVTAVLETEYGKIFTLSPHFAKMTDTLAEMIVTNPDLRRQALGIASSYSKRTDDQN